MKYKIDGIFPTPVYITSLDRKFSKTEMKAIDKIAKSIHQNESNYISDDSYILEKPVFKKLKKELSAHLLEYNKIVTQWQNVKPYITQSWLNFTRNDEYHHEHEHPNSMISGVLYVNANPEKDMIRFFNNSYKRIKPEIKNWNLFNSESWWYPVTSGDLLLFPSELTHKVDVKKGDNIRISLAFNSFVKGVLGDKRKISELEII